MLRSLFLAPAFFLGDFFNGKSATFPILIFIARFTFFFPTLSVGLVGVFPGVRFVFGPLLLFKGEDTRLLGGNSPHGSVSRVTIAGDFHISSAARSRNQERYSSASSRI